MTFQEFLNQYNGQPSVGNTTENKGQCVGLVAVWVDILGLPHIWGNACDLFANADEKFFEKILNTPDAIPQAGDIVIWSSKFNGTVGHTGLATGTGNTNTFECFEQNDPLGSGCHLKTYNYNGVIGWLRPLNIQNQQTVIDELRTARDNNWQLYQTELQKNNDLNQQLQDEQTKNQGLREANDKLTQADADTGRQLLDVSHERDVDKSLLTDVFKLLNLPVPTVFDPLDSIKLKKAVDSLKQPVEEQVKPLQQHAFSLQKALEPFITNKKYKSWWDKLWERL